MAKGRARVTHPRFGSVIVPCASKFAAIENAAEFWGVDWLDLKGAEVYAVAPGEGPLRLPREYQWIARAARKDNKGAETA